MNKLKLTKTKKILRGFLQEKSWQIIERLKGNNACQSRKSDLKDNFFEAAKLDMKKYAKDLFKKCIARSYTFRPSKKEQGKKLLPKWLKRHIKVSEKRCIFIYWGYKKNKKDKTPLCVYAGRTKGKYEGGRPFMDEFRIMKIKLYKVKSKTKLPAAECLAQHAYAPPEKTLPLANKIKASKEKGKKHGRKLPRAKCDVCKDIKKAWRILYPKRNNKESLR
ncbi:MAG: hypothetical protein V1833_05795 [Elusimicrobiota bacterium]